CGTGANGGARDAPPRRSTAAVDDETVREIVRRDGDGHTVAGYDLDVEPAKPATDASQKRVPLISLHSKMAAGERFDHPPLDLNQIISCHEAPFRVVDETLRTAFISWGCHDVDARPAVAAFLDGLTAPTYFRRHISDTPGGVMGSIVEFNCRSCGFTTENLRVGWGKEGRTRFWGGLGVCPTCKRLSVVDLAAKLDMHRCKECQGQVTWLDGLS